MMNYTTSQTPQHLSQKHHVVLFQDEIDNDNDNDNDNDSKEPLQQQPEHSSSTTQRRRRRRRPPQPLPQNRLRRRPWKCYLVATVLCIILARHIHQSLMAIKAIPSNRQVSWKKSRNNEAQSTRTSSSSSTTTTTTTTTMIMAEINPVTNQSVVPNRTTKKDSNTTNNGMKDDPHHNVEDDDDMNDKNNSNSNYTWNNTNHHSWIQKWLVQGTRGEPARILLVHVGKTGGLSLYHGVPLDVHGKRKALPCVMEKFATNIIIIARSHNQNHSSSVRTDDNDDPSDVPYHNNTLSSWYARTNAKADSNTSNRTGTANNRHHDTGSHSFLEEETNVASTIRINTSSSSSSPSSLSSSSSFSSISLPLLSLEQAWQQCYAPFSSSSSVVVQPPLGRHVISHKHIHSPSFAPQEMEWILHQQNPDVINTFLFTVRHPLHRLGSAFAYHYHRAIHRHTIMKQPSSKQQQQQQQQPQQPPSHSSSSSESNATVNNNDHPNHTTNNITTNPTQQQQQQQQPQTLQTLFYVQCFPTFYALADTLVQAAAAGKALVRHRTLHQCAQLAKDVLQSPPTTTEEEQQPPPPKTYHHSQWVRHLVYNYEYYVYNTIVQRPNVPVVVIRTEQLWSDAQQLNHALSLPSSSEMMVGNEVTNSTRNSSSRSSSKNNRTNATTTIETPFRRRCHHTHGSEQYQTSNSSSGSTVGVLATLSKQQHHRHALCCILSRDLDAYQTIVGRALNLPPHDKIQMLQQVRHDCGLLPLLPKDHGHENKKENDEDQSDNALVLSSLSSFSWIAWQKTNCAPFFTQTDVASKE